jgi:hypothetical protein
MVIGELGSTRFRQEAGSRYVWQLSYCEAGM